MNHQKNQIENFKQYLISLSKSKNTVRNYVADVTHYFEMFNEINRENILEYKERINGLATSTINCKLSSLKSFNEFLLNEGILQSIHVLKQDFIKLQSRSNPTDITEKQVSIFLNRVNTKHNIYKSRNVALINLIANSGIRREEICNLKFKNIDFENGELSLIGKGNKQRDILLTDKVIEFIKNYLVDRSKQKYFNSPYLFISERGEKLHKDTINDIFDFYSTPKCKINPHQLRHHFATVTQEQGVLTLPELQNQLGHSSLSTTGIYAQARKSNIRKKINNLQIG